MCQRVLIILILTVSLGALGHCQQKPKITNAPRPYTDPTSGVEMYRTYCAVCHGVDGKGNGPAAPALKQQPSDLTLIARRNGGEFPTFQVSNIIQGDAVIIAHGSRDMPMWGNVFRSLGDESLVKLRVHNLSDYLASIQQK